MSNGKAKLNKTQADNIVKLKREQKKQQGLNRRNSTGMGSTITASGNNVFSNNLPTNNFLSTSGGTMIGPLAIYRTNNLSLYPKSGSPPTGNNNTLDISKGTEGYSSYIYWVDAGSRTLDTISGAEFSGQILCIQNIDTTATTNNTFVIRDVSSSSSNIKTLDGNNVTLGPRPQVIMFIYSDVTGKWQQISNPQVSSGSSWVGTATSDLNMSNYDITGIANLDLDGVSATIEGIVNLQFYHTSNSINSISGDMYYQTNTSQQHQFLVAATPKLRITSSAIEADVGIDMNDNTLVQVQRIEFSNNSTDDITSTVDGIEYDVNSTDEHHFLVGGVEKLTVDSTEITLADDLNLSTNNILNSGVINFSVSGQNITPSSTELLYQVPTGDTHGFYVASTKVCEVNATYFEMQLNRFIDFGANITLSANSGFQTLPSNPVGFIKIRVNGGDARVPYYAV